MSIDVRKVYDNIGHPSVRARRMSMTPTNVDNVKDEVADLKSKSVVYEHYDMPGMAREGDVSISGDMKVASFKDPDGNVLNVAGR
jgi:hypothetical protein